MRTYTSRKERDMTKVSVYDTEAETIKSICERNEISEAELIEMLLDMVDVEELKEEYGLH